MRARHRLALAALLALAACGPPTTGPPELLLGEHECSSCRMIVGDRSTAAVGRGPAAEEARFDDLACLRRFVAEQADEAWRLWVWTDDAGGWTDARAARYARHEGRITPMGSGLFASAAASGAGLSWPDFLHAPDNSWEEIPR